MGLGKIHAQGRDIRGVVDDTSNVSGHQRIKINLRTNSTEGLSHRRFEKWERRFYKDHDHSDQFYFATMYAIVDARDEATEIQRIQQ